MNLSILQESFFNEGNSLNFENFNVWEKISSLDVLPFSAQLNQITAEDFESLPNLINKGAELFLPDFAVDLVGDVLSDEIDLNNVFSSVLTAVQSEFVPNLSFGNEEIPYDFYLEQ